MGGRHLSQTYIACEDFWGAKGVSFPKTSFTFSDHAICSTLWPELACSLKSYFYYASFWRRTLLFLLWKWYFAVYVVKYLLGSCARKIKEQNTAAWQSHKIILWNGETKRGSQYHMSLKKTLHLVIEWHTGFLKWWQSSTALGMFFLSH